MLKHSILSLCYIVRSSTHDHHFILFTKFIILSIQVFILFCVFTFRVPFCDVRCDSHIKTMFGSFVWGLMFYLHYLCLFSYNGVQHILCFVFALFFFVLCNLCCQFFWIVHFPLSLRYSLTFISKVAYNYYIHSVFQHV